MARKSTQGTFSDSIDTTAQDNDPGLGLKYYKKRKRIINKDGSFNAHRIHSGFSHRNAYQTLIKMSWNHFLLLIIASLMFINSLFAGLYLLIGVENLRGLQKIAPWHDFTNAFFFSFQTFTTVGYGHISPDSGLTSFVAAFEAMIGLMCFALVTGLIYGRFSRPTARLLYSEKALISPYKEGLSLKFRLANKRMSTLLEMKVTVLLQMIVKEKIGFSRRFVPLDLERDFILFFPLNWTVVHPINEESPLYGKGPEDLKEMDAEILIMVRGFDDTFGQTVHSRHSYLCSEVEWGAEFRPAYFTNDDGEVILDMRELHEYTSVDLPPVKNKNQSSL